MEEKITPIETSFVFACSGDKERIVKSDEGKVLFSYKVISNYDKSIGQQLCIFFISVYECDDIFNIFSFSIIETYPDIGINVMTNRGSDKRIVHESTISTEEELEPRLFQIETIVDVYDLDTSIIDKMHQLREIFFKPKDETIFDSVV